MTVLKVNWLLALDSMPISSAVACTLALQMYTFCDSVIPLLSCAYLGSNMQWCLLSFVSLHSCTVNASLVVIFKGGQYFQRL